MAFTVASCVPTVLDERVKIWTVTFSDPPLASSVQSNDFTINTIGANSVAYTVGALVAVFTFNTSPIGAPGSYVMAIAAGSILRASDNLAINGFSQTSIFNPGFIPNMVEVPCIDGIGNPITLINAACFSRGWVVNPAFANLAGSTIWGDFNMSPGYVGKLYLFEWFLENVPQPCVFSLPITETLPPGLSLGNIGSTARGAILGVPTAQGTYVFALEAKMALAFSLKTFSIVVFGYAPLWGNFIFPPAYLGVPYLFDWYLENISYPVEFSLVSGSLPSSMTLITNNSIGVLVGTATELGNYSFVLRATNSEGYDEKAFTFKVIPDPNEGSGFIYGN